MNSFHFCWGKKSLTALNIMISSEGTIGMFHLEYLVLTPQLTGAIELPIWMGSNNAKV